MTPIDEIKNRLDVVDVIQSYIKLKKAGKDYKASCPFHKEKNPSFYVSPSKQIWHCFSCSRGGDIFTFVQDIEGVEFPDALRTLAKKAGVVLKKQDPKIYSKKTVLYNILEEAVDLYEKNLKENKKIHEYLKKRGIEGKTAKDFKIGFALDSWDNLHKHLVVLGFKASDIEKAGLLSKKDSRFYDRFRSRIMFPIFDLNSQVIGFSGRIFEKEDGTGKYINTPETLLYNKSSVIYGLDKAKIDIRKKDQCILVEGQFDVIMNHQIGFKNTIAISGTALTSEHLKILKRYTENLVFAFDADTGGEAATKKAIRSAQELEFNIKVVLLPKDKDPADIIKSSSEKWKKLVNNSKPVMDFYFENTFSKYSSKLSVDHKREISKELLYPIKNINNLVEQAHWIQVLASKLNVDEKTLIEALNRIKSRESGKETKYEINKKSRIKELEEYVFGLSLIHSKYLKNLMKGFKNNPFEDENLKKLFLILKSDKKPSQDLKNLKDYLIFKAEHFDLIEEEIEQEIDSCIKQIKSFKLKAEMNRLSLDIKQAESKKDKKLKSLTERFSKLANELNKIYE